MKRPRPLGTRITRLARVRSCQSAIGTGRTPNGAGRLCLAHVVEELVVLGSEHEPRHQEAALVGDELLGGELQVDRAAVLPVEADQF